MLASTAVHPPQSPPPLRLSADPADRHIPLWTHLVLWSLLLATDALQFRQLLIVPEKHEAGNYVRDLWQQGVLRAVVTDALYAAIFYLNWRELIPRILARGRVMLYAVSVVLMLALFVGLRLAASRWLFAGGAEGLPPHALPKLIVPYSLMGLMMIFLSSALKVTGDYLRERRNRRELERQQLLTELSLLKMQVNPHFLFNTLNNIYSLASQKSDRTPEAVLRLSELMRYQLYGSADDVVPLSRELQHLRSFLELQRLRLPVTEQPAIVFDTVEPLPEAWPVAPMLLLPLVENAFKHGDLMARPVATLQLQLTSDGALQFVVENAVAPAGSRPPAGLEPAGGVGLVNLRRRLALLYPGRHQLDIAATPERYRAALTLWSAAR